MPIKFEVKMTDKAMYDFLLYHYYTHSGLLSTLLGVVCLAVSINSGMKGNFSNIFVFGLLAVIMIFMEPINLKQTAKRQVKNTESFQQPLLYEISDEGITVKQNGETETSPWEEFTKAVSTSKSIIVYITRVRAVILPKEALGDDYMAVVEKISTHMPARKVKIRHVK